MKKTLTINLAGIVFNIDEDAYEVLQQYLRKLENRFSGEDGKEIMSDIEARIAELFTNGIKQPATAVVTIDQVNSIIEQLGTAEEIDSDTSTGADHDSKPQDEKNRRRHRKFYRNADNKILGGVAAGVAAYLGFDTTIVRLLFILLAITIFGWLIPIYLVVWLIAPEAKTTAQKLEMQGIEPSVENIKEYLNSERFRESADRIGSRLGDLFKWLVRIAAIVVGSFFIVIGAFAIGVFIIVLLALLVGSGSVFGILLSSIFPASMGNSVIIAFIVSALLALLIPVISILMTTIRLIRRDNTPRRKGWRWFWFILWLLACIVSCCTLIFNAPQIVQTLHNLDDNNFIFVVDNDIITEERLRDVAFTSINVESNLMVYLQQDTCNYVEVKSNAHNIRNIETKVEDGELHLSLRAPIGKLTNGKGVVVHYCSTLEKINIGSASIVTNAKENLIANNLELDIESAAVVNLGIKCDKLDVDASSASVINLWGECNQFEANLSSAAVAVFKDLAADTASIEASSGAVIELPKTEKIDIESSAGAIIK